MARKSKPWVGVDFDKTLAKHSSGQHSLGAPVGPMVSRVKKMISSGKDVRVLTARPKSSFKAIGDWTEEHVGKRLRVTNSKSPSMKVLYDDRVRRVKPNKGTLM